MTIRSPRRQHEHSLFFKYTDFGTATQILASRSLRWSAPNRFNDPLDVARDFHLDFSAIAFQDTIKQGILEVLQGRRLTSNPILQYLTLKFLSETDLTKRDELLDSLGDALQDAPPLRAGTLEGFKDVWREMVPRLRILCLSEVADSLPMWAHYADKHRGVVLELAVSDERDSSWLLAQPVIYSDSPPTLPPKEVWAAHLLEDRAVNWPEWFREYHYVKLTQWSYEREWRIVTYAADTEVGEYSDMSFHPRDLTAIYLGADMPSARQNEILGLLSGDLAHVKALRGRLDRERRRLTFEPME